jgi:hypothetical protein
MFIIIKGKYIKINLINITIYKFRNNIYFELIVFKVAFSCQINICIIYYKVLKLDN